MKSKDLERTPMKPKQILIETTNFCNLRCKGCLILEEKPSHFPLGRWKDIVDQNEWDATIIPYMYGEPMLWKHLVEGTRYVLEKGMRYYIATNGTIWNDEFFDLITDDNRAYQIIFSLDGLPWNSAARAARPGADPMDVWDNIREFVELKERKGSDINVAIKLIRRGQDYAEIQDFIRHWLTYEGADYVAIGQLFEGRNETSMRHKPCWYPKDFYMMIRNNGDVARCMYNAEALRPEYRMGHIDDGTLLEVYNNEKFRELRKYETYPCDVCPNAYNGTGFTGTVKDQSTGDEYSYHEDYYNQFYSLKDERVGVQYENTSNDRD